MVWWTVPAFWRHCYNIALFFLSISHDENDKVYGCHDDNANNVEGDNWPEDDWDEKKVMMMQMGFCLISMRAKQCSFARLRKHIIAILQFVASLHKWPYCNVKFGECTALWHSQGPRPTPRRWIEEPMTRKMWMMTTVMMMMLRKRRDTSLCAELPGQTEVFQFPVCRRGPTIITALIIKIKMTAYTHEKKILTWGVIISKNYDQVGGSDSTHHPPTTPSTEGSLKVRWSFTSSCPSSSSSSSLPISSPSWPGDQGEQAGQPVERPLGGKRQGCRHHHLHQNLHHHHHGYDQDLHLHAYDRDHQLQHDYHHHNHFAQLPRTKRWRTWWHNLTPTLDLASQRYQHQNW